MDIATSVKKTLAYASFFKYPITSKELHFWLISPKTTPYSSLTAYFPKLNSKEKQQKQILLKNTQKKEKLASLFVKYARFIPSIRLIALTGSVAANNTKKNDDIDLLIITSAHTLWLTRPFVLLLLTIFFKRRHPGDRSSNIDNAFCPNLWLDTLSLSIPEKRRNIYTAHETLQIKPIFDRGNTYQRFLDSNRWTSTYLANAYHNLHAQGISRSHRSLLSYILAPVNLLFFLIQYFYMCPKISTETVSVHSAYFHKNDLSSTLTSHLKTILFSKKTL